MKKLIKLLQDNLEGDDQDVVPVVVQNAVVETRLTQQAAKRLKSFLPKLGQSTYDLAIKNHQRYWIGYGQENVGPLSLMCNL